METKDKRSRPRQASADSESAAAVKKSLTEMEQRQICLQAIVEKAWWKLYAVKCPQVKCFGSRQYGLSHDLSD